MNNSTKDNDIDVLKYLYKKFNIKIDENDIEEIKDFLLLWNLFESICCNKRANINCIDRIIDSKIELFKEENYKDIFDYFYNRYKNNNSKLEKLNLTLARKKLVQNVLNDNYQDKNNKLKFIISIIYRYRNNLFHGEKDLKFIKLQKENFTKTNKFLMYFIEICKS
jgi:hypothetical protein